MGPNERSSPSPLGVADYAIAFADELETPHARCARLVIG
jgi:putative NADH-flavin reductase